MTPPFLISAYLALSRVLGPAWAMALRMRARRGKEDPSRLAEKHGIGARPRPAGPLVWMHGVSVGESGALITLIERLLDARPDAHVLLTTITLASARALEGRALPARVIHQYLPMDTPAATRRFLDHWRPDVLAVAEADLWPRLLSETRARGVPMLLLNTHVTPRRYRRRKRIAAANGWLMDLFDTIHVQDETSRKLYLDLGAPADKMEVTGVLKAAAAPLPDRPGERARLVQEIGGRPSWLAASTRRIEEPLLFEAHAMALEALPDLLMIIAPRQMAEAEATEAAALARFAPEAVARRSRGAQVTPQTRVYIADTLGEMGVWYRLAPVAYTGNSMPVPGTVLTGKNPFEAVALGVMVLHGPHVGNFREAYGHLQAEGGALEVADAAAMARAVVAAQDPAWRAPFITGAARVQAANAGPLDKALGAVLAALGPQATGRG